MATPQNVEPLMVVEWADDAGPAYRTNYEGFGNIHTITKLPTKTERGRKGIIPLGFCLEDMGVVVPTEESFERGGKNYASSIMAISGFPDSAKPIICRPMQDTRRVGDNYVQNIVWPVHFDKFGIDHEDAAQTYWRKEYVPFPPRMVYEGPCGGSDVWTRYKSKFTLPANPVMCFELRRMPPFVEGDAKPGGGFEESNKWKEYDKFYTQIRFAINEFGYHKIKIPFNGKVTIWWNDTRYTDGKEVELKSRTDFSYNTGRSEFGASDNEQDNMKYLWVYCSWRGIAISKDKLKTCAFFYHPEWGASWDNPFTTLQVLPGKIDVYNNTGKWDFAFIPVLMVPIAALQGPVYDLSYPWAANGAPYISLVNKVRVMDYDFGAHKWVQAETEAGSGVPATALIEPIMGVDDLLSGVKSRVAAAGEGSYGYEYLLGIRSSKYVDLTTGLTTYRSPDVYEAIFGQLSTCEDKSGEIDFSPVIADDLSAQASLDSLAASGSVVFDGQLADWGVPLSNWAPRRIRVYGGFRTKT